MNEILLTYAFVIHPTTSQKKSINKWIETCMIIYNLAREAKIYSYKKGKPYSKYDLSKQVTDLRSGFKWIRDVDSSVLQNVIERLDSAYCKFFQGAGYPKLATKNKYSSFTTRNCRIVKSGVLRIGKIGHIKFNDTRGVDCSLRVRMITILYKHGKYYAYLLVIKDPSYLPVLKNKIGIDMGITNFISTSDGGYYSIKNHLDNKSRELSILFRKLSRQKENGKNWRKTKNKIRDIYKKSANQRKDSLHKMSLKIIKENQIIVVEDLSVKNMILYNKHVGGYKGGYYNKRLRGLNIAGFLNMLKYKSDLYGRDFIKVDPAYTSQDCNACGYRSKENRKSQSKFECVACGHKDNADVNAAKNILGKGAPYVRERELVN